MQYDVHTIALLAIANNNTYIFVIITNSKIIEEINHLCGTVSKKKKQLHININTVYSTMSLLIRIYANICQCPLATSNSTKQLHVYTTNILAH